MKLQMNRKRARSIDEEEVEGNNNNDVCATGATPSNVTTSTNTNDNYDDGCVKNNNEVKVAKLSKNSAATIVASKEPKQGQLTKKLFSIFTSKKATIPKQVHPKNETRKPQIYCDLDGVLVDMNFGIQQLENIYNKSKNPNKPRAFNMWAAIQRTPHFYRTLPFTSDGQLLWDTIQHLQPHILTGLPSGNLTHIAAVDKYKWCQRELQFIDTNNTVDETKDGDSCTAPVDSTTNTPSTTTTATTPPTPTTTTTLSTLTAAAVSLQSSSTHIHYTNSKQWSWRNMAGPKKAHKYVNGSDRTIGTSQANISISSNDEYIPTVITCWSTNKHYECHTKGDVLIDDRPYHYELQQKWTKAGGIFIHHTSTKNTIEQLQKHGILK